MTAPTPTHPALAGLVELHHPIPIFPSWMDCDADDHDCDPAEGFCRDCPAEFEACETCRDEDGSWIEWPCATGVEITEASERLGEVEVRESDRLMLVPGSAEVERGLHRLIDHLSGEALAKHRHEWADYIDHWDGAVGPEPPTVRTIVAALRSNRVPFGVVAAELVEPSAGGAS